MSDDNTAQPAPLFRAPTVFELVHSDGTATFVTQQPDGTLQTDALTEPPAPPPTNDIDAAADSLALQRIQAKDYRIAAARNAWHQDECRRLQAEGIEALKEQTAAAVRVAEGIRNFEQEQWMDLYKMHLAVRLGPSVISTATSDAIQKDMVLDSVMMTTFAWPMVRVELDKLKTPAPAPAPAPPQSGVN